MPIVNPHTDVQRVDRKLALDPSLEVAHWEGSREVHEQFRRLRGLLVASAPAHLSIAIASIRDSMAAAWVASHLAWAFAESGESALLALAAGGPPQAGLRANGGGAALDLDLGDDSRGFSIRSTQRSHISVVNWREEPEVPSNTALALAIPKLRDLTRALLIACEPLAESSQCLELAQPPAGMLLVLDATRDSKAEVQRQTEIMKRAGVRVLGAVLNNREADLPAPIERML